MAGYCDEPARTREMPNSRYDGLKSGRVKPVSGKKLLDYFREKSAAARQSMRLSPSPVSATDAPQIA
jgi:hypothetical protein